MFGLFSDIEVGDWPMIPHHSRPHFAACALLIHILFPQRRDTFDLMHMVQVIGFII
jgi:hypothetical protein